MFKHASYYQPCYLCKKASWDDCELEVSEHITIGDIDDLIPSYKTARISIEVFFENPPSWLKLKSIQDYTTYEKAYPVKEEVLEQTTVKEELVKSDDKDVTAVPSG